VEEALASDVPLESVIASHSFAGSNQDLLARLERRTLVYLAKDDLLEAASPVKTPGGIVAIASVGETGIAHVFAMRETEGAAYRAAMAVALVDVQDPGNAGAVVRSAEAAGGTGVIACDGTADLRGWKALRASMGSAFRVPIAHASIDALFDAARASDTRVVAATVDSSSADMRDIRWREPFVLLVGNEGRGLPASVAQRAELRVRIPMFGRVQSMNAAVSAAVILYEAQRQRG
jgi:RNA methyltransferase, TrmH family